MKVDVIYFIEHVARELDIGCAIKACLEKSADISVEIRSIAHNLEETISKFDPKVVVLPYCNGVINRPPEKMIPHWPGAKYISMSFEQVLGKAQLKFIQQKDEFTRAYLLHSVWGSFYQDVLLKTGVQAENIHINGSPTLNLYRPPYRDYYPQDRLGLARKYDLDPEKKWIFVPGNYGWAFFHDKLVRDRINRGFDPQHAYQYREFSRRSLELTAEWWCGASQFPGVELIVRPRPATPDKDFRAVLDGLALSIPRNMHIIKDGTVREWILVSDIVMSSFSTTLIEAAVAHKPIYMLTPVPLPDFIFTEWYDHVMNIHSLDEFNTVCGAKEIEPNWKPLENWVDNTLFSGSDAIMNIAEMIIDVLNGPVQLNSPRKIAEELTQPTVSNLYRKFRKQIWKLYQGSINILGAKTQEQKRKPHEKDHFSNEIIKEEVDKWRELLETRSL